MLLQQLRAGLVSFGFLTVLTGVAYPAFVTGVAHVAFPKQANGSLIVKGGTMVGSELIGQSFDDPKYFWGRISATTPAYNASASAGSNLAATNAAFTGEVQARLDALHSADPDNQALVPVDLVTSSASGLDPDISPAAAEYQLARVARARHLDEAQVRQLVLAHTEGRALGALGEPRVHVLTLNLALDGK